MEDKLMEHLKLSLRLEEDEDTDDVLLRNYLLAAQEYIKGAVGIANPSFFEKEEIIPLYETAVIALASGYYLYRSALVPVTMHPVNLSVNALVGQLRARYCLYQEAEGEINGS